MAAGKQCRTYKDLIVMIYLSHIHSLAGKGLALYGIASELCASNGGPTYTAKVDSPSSYNPPILSFCY